MNHHDTSHGTYISYVIGFILSVALTLLAYFAVTMQNFSSHITFAIITMLAFMQFIVQVLFFLHITTEERPRWNLTSFVFALVITFIVFAGSLWVMYNMNFNML